VADHRRIVVTSVKPLMVGVIAGRAFSGLFWMVVGRFTTLLTGKAPTAYSIFPL